MVDGRSFGELVSIRERGFRAANPSRSCWSPQGGYVAAGTVDGKVMIWDTSSGKKHKEFAAHKGKTVSSVEWSRRGSMGSVDTSGVLALYS